MQNYQSHIVYCTLFLLLPLVSFGQTNPNDGIWRDINGVHDVTEDSIDIANEVTDNWAGDMSNTDFMMQIR